VASIPSGKAGFVATRLPVALTPTLFARFGNILPMVFALLLAIGGVALARHQRYGRI
jgi:apolipoprotein N-acyltransferase